MIATIERVKRALIYLVVMIAGWLLPDQSFAQGTDIGISGVGLFSFQPTNDWVGSPYLDEGIGGQAPGLAAGVSVFMSNGLAVIGEFSTTRAFEQFQRGRLVSANTDRFGQGSGTARLRDTLVSGLIGYATANRAQRVAIVGGISGVMTTLTQDGESVNERPFDESGFEGRRRFALTGGLDFLQRLSTRASLLIDARYSWLGRSENADQTGAGAHILRIGAGVRIRLND